MNPNDWPNEIEALLRAAHKEPIDPSHYTAVRARVIAEIERTRSPWRRLAWVSLWVSGVAALAAALLFAFVLRQPGAVPLPAPLAIAIPPAPAAPVVKPRPVQVAHAKAPRRTPREPLTIKLQTSDPNIVIYWIAD